MTGEEYWISGPKKDGTDRLYGERSPVEIATIAGVFVAIAMCWVGYLVTSPWRNDVVAYFAKQPLCW